MQKILITIFVMTLVGILAGGTCIAAVPGSISYQGKLTNTLGQPVSDGAYQVQFKLYTVITAGVAFWTSAVKNVTTSGGVFTTTIEGTSPALTPSVLSGKTDVWLEIWVGSPLAALSPRTKFTSVPYALISGDSWSLLGNAGTTPGTNFVGTTDNKALEFKVNNTRALRLEQPLSSYAPNVIGGYSGNTVTAGAYGATISGGGENGFPNSVTQKYATVGGGFRNTASGNYATVGGGAWNTASGICATVGGGDSNNASGNYSFAAGRRAQANHNGAFVWADSAVADFASTADNQFLIRASGGVGIGTTSPSYTLHVNGSAGKPGGGSWTDSSDFRLKTNVRAISGALEHLLALRGVTYEWKDPAEHGNLIGAQIGMVAQDVEKVFPQWIGEDPQGFKTLTFRGFEALTVEALRQQKKTIDDQQKQIEVQQKMIDDLRAKNAEIDERLAAIETKSAKD